MNRLVTGAAVAALMVAAAATADARIVAVEIEKTEPFASGTSFGAAGEYETEIFILRPADPAKATAR